MKAIGGIYWPDDVGEKWRHAFKHVKSLDFALRRCVAKGRLRTAVQAGGNIGLWPLALARSFARVVTFEPDAVSRACLARNVRSARVEVRPEAVGDAFGRADIVRASLGSHYVAPGTSVEVVPIDALAIDDLDLLQLDVEGSELAALRGAASTIARCRPAVVQVELREFSARYGATDAEVVAFLRSLGYREAARLPGNDVAFEEVA